MLIQALDTLFYALDNRADGSTAFETSEQMALYDEFRDIMKDEINSEETDLWDSFLRCTENERRTAFKIGFKTALSLFAEEVTR